MTSDVAAVMQERWSLIHDDRYIEFYRLRNVFVVAEGLIFDGDGRLFAASVGQHTTEVIQWAAGEVSAAMTGGTRPTIRGTTLLCGRPGLSNYGHWLGEILPIVFLSRQIGRHDEFKVFIPQLYPWMREVISDSLDLLKVPGEARLTGDGYVYPEHFEEIIFVKGISEHGYYYGKSAIECADEMSTNIPPGDAKRLWMSRVGQRRCLLNEGSAVSALEHHGWTVVEAQGLSLTQQISLAKGATHLAGVQGAAMTNLLFMRPGTKVTSLVPARMPDNFYWTLSQHRCLDYCEVRCPQDLPPNWHIPWDSELAVSVPDLLAIISR